MDDVQKMLSEGSQAQRTLMQCKFREPGSKYKVALGCLRLKASGVAKGVVGGAWVLEMLMH